MVMTTNKVQDRPDEEITYRSVSVLAIVGLLVGLLAPLSMVAPLLWAIPIVGAAISLAAIVRIAGSDGALVGRGAALIGLALCVASISAAASRAAFSKYFVSREARDVALEWIATLQAGHDQQAFERTVEAARLQSAPPTTTPQQEHDHTQQPGDDHGHEHEHEHEDSPLERFREDPVVDFLMTGGAKLQASFDRDLAVEFAPRKEARIEQQFALRADGHGAAQAVWLQIVLVRSSTSALGPPRWLISKFQSDDLPSSSPAAR
jgi:hypothetical protein